MARFIAFLRDVADLQFENIHIIGHSLGAHVAGFASRPFHGKIGRISGRLIKLILDSVSDFVSV